MQHGAWRVRAPRVKKRRRREAEGGGDACEDGEGHAESGRGGGGEVCGEGERDKGAGAVGGGGQGCGVVWERDGVSE